MAATSTRARDRSGSSQSAESVSTTAAAPTQTQILGECLADAAREAKTMRFKLESGATMEAFKHASLMLSTLRTSMLTPKNYYELYSSIFDVLSQDLSPYLVDGHMRGIHSLAHLYELVQYAGNIVPRLYLMITVGAAYMKVATLSTQMPDSTATREFENTEIPPIKELLNDLLEMARGVQHPTRGLFLRYYLSVMTRDHMPNHTTDGPLGTLSTSIHFIQQNFIEMNKLWVRLQFIGHSSERDRREAERKELRVIVGSGLVRLSQLDGLEWQDYKETVLPRLLSEIVSCKDAIAQEYLMDIIIQVFPEDFHFRTLDLLLSAASQLSKSVNVRQTVIGLIDRFIDFATRMQEEADEVQRALSSGSIPLPTSGIPGDIPLFELFWEQITALVSTRNEFSLQDTAALLVSLMKLSLNCYPDRLDHVDKVLGFAKDRFAQAKRKSMQDPKTSSAILQLLLSPIQAYKYNPLTFLKFPSSRTQSHTRNYLIEPHPTRPASASYCGHFTDLLKLLPHVLRRKVAHAVATSALAAATVAPTSVVGKAGDRTKTLLPFLVDSVDAVEALFGELCVVLVADCGDGDICGAALPPLKPGQEEEEDEEEFVRGLDWENIVEEQTMIARLIHLVRSRSGDPDDDVELLVVLRKFLGTGGDVRIRFTLPAFVFECLRVAQRYLGVEDMSQSTISVRLLSLYQFIRETISALSRAKYMYNDGDDAYIDVPPLFGTGMPTPAEVSFRLFISAASCADQSGHEVAAYEFHVEALTLYEEALLDSKAQAAAIPLLIGALAGSRVLQGSNYGTLVAKCVACCSRLLKKSDQSRALMMAAHLFWGADRVEGVESAMTFGTHSVRKRSGSMYEELFGAQETEFRTATGTGQGWRDGKRILECLQRGLKVADSVLDPAVHFQLFVVMLERYVWMMENSVDSIHIRHVNALIQLIRKYIAGLEHLETEPPVVHEKTEKSIFSIDGVAVGSSAGQTRLPIAVRRHFDSILAYLENVKRKEHRQMEISGGGVNGFGTSRRKWSELQI